MVNALPVTAAAAALAAARAYLNMETTPLFMSRALKEVGGKARAVHRKALAIDVWVATR